MYPVDLCVYTVAGTYAYSTLSDYIAQAEQEGIKLFAITDHSPDTEGAPYYQHFINMRIWPWVIGGAGILRGTEANIKNIDSKIDCSGRMSDSLDLITTDFHESMFAPHDKAISAQTMIATIASGNVYIISHPGDPGCEVDAKTVAEAAAKYQVALEINNSSFLHSRRGSEGNCRAVAAAVRDTGGWVTLGSDFHTVFTMGEFEECFEALDVVDFPSERILNVSPRRLLSFLGSRGTAPIAEFTDL